MKDKKQKIPESLRQQLSKAGKASWQAKLKKAKAAADSSESYHQNDKDENSKWKRNL